MKINVELTDKEWEQLSKMMKNSKDKYIMSVEAKFNGRIIIDESVKTHHRNKPLNLDIARKDAEELRKNLIENQTTGEKLTKAVLKALDIDYNFHKIIFGRDDLFIVDFYIPEYKMVIEVDEEIYNINEQKKVDIKLSKLSEIKFVNYIGRISFKESKSSILIEDKINYLLDQVLKPKLV